MLEPRLTEEQIGRMLVLWGNLPLANALRQVRGDLKYQTELGEACASNLLSMQAERDAAREQVRVLREILSEINEGIIDQRRRNYCDICYCVGTHKQTCRMVAALAASEQEVK